MKRGVEPKLPKRRVYKNTYNNGQCPT